jgi:hypothetical protein
VADPDDQLAGQLLRTLYPKTIKPEALLRYLHIPKKKNFTGSYSMFWRYELLRIAPASHLPILLDQFAARSDLFFAGAIRDSFHYKRMVGALITKGIEIHGENITDARLFVWLGIGNDKYVKVRRDDEHLETISGWLGNHPEGYKAILALCFKQCEEISGHTSHCIYTQMRRLHGAAVPVDIGLWHLEQASHIANDALAQHHIAEAVNTFIQGRGSTGLSLEKIEAWGKAHPERQHWLSPLLKCEIEDWRREDSATVRDDKIQHDDNIRKRSIALNKHLDAIRSGTASSGQMHELAGVWMDHYIDTYGETPLERFDSYCENADKVLETAEAGFFLCPERHDLPSVAEIIDLSTKQQQHFIRNPCLISMELHWRQDESCIDALSDDTLRRMLAFRITYDADNTPEWFTHLVRERPSLLAEVLVDYASTTLKAGRDVVSCIYPLAHDPDYRNVAQIAVPQLLGRFPVRARSGQLSQLEYLLKAALHYSAEQLPEIIERKLAQEIDRLLTLPTLSKLKYSLENARYQLKLKQRETAFRFPSVSDVAGILANREPTSSADLTALTVEHLDEIAHEIRHDNDDGVRTFWNIESKTPTGKREENLCRDILLTRLRISHRLLSIANLREIMPTTNVLTSVCPTAMNLNCRLKSNVTTTVISGLPCVAN